MTDIFSSSSSGVDRSARSPASAPRRLFGVSGAPVTGMSRNHGCDANTAIVNCAHSRSSARQSAGSCAGGYSTSRAASCMRSSRSSLLVTYR
ncbi:Uncharacterised protein [Mycobacteroides abscessus]|nr:Uncharacterised protein [Mycobacteroides abscessus]